MHPPAFPELTPVEATYLARLRRRAARTPRWARAVPVCVALAAVMVFSPLGPALFTGLNLPSPSALLADMEAPFLAMFPQASEVGPLPETQPLDVGIGVPVHDPAGLDSFIQATTTPGSPLFQKFLTPAQFDSLYAPSVSAYESDLQYFEQYGIHVQPSSDRLIISLSGDPDQMSAAFHTSFAEFALDGSTYYGMTRAASLPSSLAVSGVYGLTNAFNYRPGNLIEPAATQAPSQSGPLVPAAACNGGGLTPTEVQDAYRVNELIGAGDEGSGMSIAVVDTYDPGETPAQLATDYSTFSTNCGLAAITPQFQYPVPFPAGTNTSGTNDWGGETALDMQWSHVMAEKADLYPVQTPDSGFSLYSAVNYLLETDLVNVISLSWGEPTIASQCSVICNASWTGSYQTFHPILQAAAAEGISVTVASGDCGADDGDDVGIPTPDYPASDEDATGIGGSVLTMAANGTWYGSESTTSPITGTCRTTSQWCGNESNCPYNSGAAGGGWAPTPQPWYQFGPGIVNKGLRGVPDVGITVGEPLDYVCTGDGVGGASYTYGTSDGAPQWAGLIATADAIAGHGLGLINPALYAMLRSTDYPYYFHEVTTGEGNGYAPTTYWDPISGVGTPIASNVVPYLAHNGYLPPYNPIQAGLAASVTSGAAPLTVTFTTTVSGGTGTYPVYSFYWGDGTSSETRTSTLPHTYTSDGTYAAQVEVFDSAGNSTLTQAVMITVGVASTLSVALSSSNTDPAVGSQVTFTATTTGGKSPFTFGYYFGDGTYLFGGYNAKTTSPNKVGHTFEQAGTYCVDASANDSSAPQLGATSNVVTEFVGGAVGPCDNRLTAPTASFNRTTCETSCEVTLDVAFTGSLPAFTTTVEWADGTAPTISTGAPTSVPLTHIYANAGTFKPHVFVNDSVGESVNAFAGSSVQVLPQLSLSQVTPSVSSSIAPANVTFGYTVAAGTGSGTITGWSWTFGDGNTSTLQTPPFQLYLRPGTYTTTLVITDSLGVQAGASAAVTVTGSAAPAISLLTGENLIADPLQSNDYTLYALELAVGPTFLSAQDLHGSTTTTFARGGTTGNTAVLPGDAIWVDVSGPVSLTLFGTAAASLPGEGVTASTWSAVGWSVSGSTSASALGTLIGNGVEDVSAWNAATQTWVTFVVGFDAPGGEYDFTISAGQAFYVWTSGSGTFSE